jgi:dolichol-phosphate mannosyltransferase
VSRLLEHPFTAVLKKKMVTGSQFATVGALGIVVNQALFWLFDLVLDHSHILAAAALATQGSTTFNFVGTESWVFGSRRSGGFAGVAKRFLAYDAVNSSTLLVRLPLLQVLTAGFDMNPLVANLITLVTLTVLRYAIADSLIWSSRVFVGRTP